MREFTKAEVRKLTNAEIAGRLRRAASYGRDHRIITWEHGIDLIAICALHGDLLADALDNMESDT